MTRLEAIRKRGSPIRIKVVESSAPILNLLLDDHEWLLSRVERLEGVIKYIHQIATFPHETPLDSKSNMLWDAIKPYIYAALESEERG